MLSETRLGFESLLCSNNFFLILYDYIAIEECALIIGNIMFGLDFYRDSVQKKILNEHGKETVIKIGPK